MTDLTSVNKKIKRAFSDWQAVELIGAGTFGEVYRAECTDAPGCTAAIKVITIPKNEEEICLLRSDSVLFEREFSRCTAAATALSNELAKLNVLSGVPNILGAEAYSVKISENGCSYDVIIRTELLTPITKMPEVAEQEAVKLGVDICIALEACAKHGIVHRDIKPSNIFCTDYGTYKLGDFGIAKVLEGTSGELTMYTGTPKFMAPEAVMGMEYDASADIYSLGMVLYYILNGMTPPFYPTHGSSLSMEDADTADLRRVRGDDLPSLNGVSAELMEVLHKACNAAPEARYADASEMKQALVNVYTAILFGRATGAAVTTPVKTEKWDTTTLFEIPTDETASSASTVKTGTAVYDTTDSFNAEEYAAALGGTGEFDTETTYQSPKKKKGKTGLLILLILVLALFTVGTVFAVGSLIGIISDFSGGDTDEVSDTVEVIPEGEPVSLAIAAMPKNLEFVTGKKVTLDGLELEATYEDGTTVTVSDGFIIYPDRFDEPGEYTVAVMYKGASVELHVSAVSDADVGDIADASVISLVMKSLPNKLDYYAGESLNTDGMRLDVTYDSGVMATVSEGFTVTPEKFQSVGEQTVTVSYGGKEITFEVNVSAAVFKSIKMRTPPKKTIYFAGEALVTDGLTISEIYTDGSAKAVTSGFTVSPTVLNTPGEQYITVSYRGKTTGFNVTVNSVTLTSISIRTMPAKLDYSAGDKVDLTGLTLSAVYSNGVTETVPSDFVGVTPSVISASGAQTVTVSYGGKTASFNITAADPISDNGTCGNSLTWTLKNGVLTINGSGVMYDYTAGAAPWSKHAQHIKSVSISDEVTSIGSYAFSYLPITSLSVPKDVRSISDTAVYMCTSLKVISVSTNNRFYQSKDGVLYSKDMTKMYIYPAGKSDSTFTVPSTVTTIAGHQIFRGAVFKELILTESVYSIDSTAFFLAPNIEKITVRARSSALASVDGVLFNKSMNELIYFPVNKKVTDYTVPETVRYIREHAFADNTALTSITLSAELKSVGTNAFAGCTSLKKVTYAGSYKDWSNISFGDGNGSLTNASIDFGK